MNPKAAARVRLNAAIVRLDDEAFSWLALALLPAALARGAHAQVWPDGVGGFRFSERVDAVRIAAEEYVRYVA